MKSKYNAVFFVLLAVTAAMNVFSKDSFKDKKNKEQAGHADDISKLLTGNAYNTNKGNTQLYTTLKGMTYLMYLVVDSTINMNKDKEYFEVNDAVAFLKENMKQLNFNSISNFRDFLTPNSGNTHGHYSHLGWDHIYPDDDILTTTRGDIVVNTQKKWEIRKKILIDAMGKTFNFSILESKKKDSLGALFYYVHMLGDHEDNSVATAYTRLPIENKYEQMHLPGFREWEKDPRWTPGDNETILKELKKHLEILFADQRSKPNGLYYNNLMRGLNSILPDNQTEKARYVLALLFSNVPSLLKESSFAKDFYKKNQIKVNSYIPIPYIISEQDIIFEEE